MLEYPIVVYEPMCWSVYVHTVPKEVRSSPNRDDYFDKYYVGITKRPPVEHWGGNGYEYRGQIFGGAIRLYGWENIKHEVIVSNWGRLLACQFEIYLIERLKSFVKDGHGYNGTRGGEGFLGVRKFGEDNPFFGKHHSEETREKMKKNHWDNKGVNNQFWGHHHTEETRKKLSEINKQRYKDNPESFKKTKPMSEEQKRKVGEVHSKPVYVFDMNLNFLGEFLNVIGAADHFNLTRRVAETIVNNVRKADYDYIIKFKSEIPDIKIFQETYQIKTYTPSKHNTKTLDLVDNPVYMFDNNYNLISEFKNHIIASKETGISIDNIDSCCNYGRKYVGDYVFVLKYNVYDLEKYVRIKRNIKNKISKQVEQYDPHGNLLATYNSINDAKNQTGYTYYSIYQNCENNTQEGNGYIWRYKGVDYE